MNKDVHAVDLVRQIRDDIYEQTKEMSASELVEFFRRSGSAAKEKISRAQEKRRDSAKRMIESH